jgi:hypothetical protein
MKMLLGGVVEISPLVSVDVIAALLAGAMLVDALRRKRATRDLSTALPVGRAQIVVTVVGWVLLLGAPPCWSFPVRAFPWSSAA